MKAVRLSHLFALFVLAFSSACAAAVGVSGPFRVPADSLAQCQAHCGTMGMSTGAVVVMADNVGCVCEEQGASADLGASAAMGAMGAIVAEQREQEERRQQQQASAAVVR